MRNLAVLLATLTLATSCSGALAGVRAFDRNSSTDVSFPADGTEASGQLLAFDPSKHSLDIEIALPLAQTDDIDIFIITSSGIRFQVLSSFQGCEVSGAGRRCSRHIPVLPSEGIDNWRVEAQRDVAGGPTSVRVDVTWVPTG